MLLAYSWASFGGTRDVLGWQNHCLVKFNVDRDLLVGYLSSIADWVPVTTCTTIAGHTWNVSVHAETVLRHAKHLLVGVFPNAGAGEALSSP